MAGQKGKSGGARTPRDPATAKKRGPLIVSNRDAPLDKERARALKLLILSRGWEYTPQSVARLPMTLIERELVPIGTKYTPQSVARLPMTPCQRSHATKRTSRCTISREGTHAR